jgi:hypothetical protein
MTTSARERPIKRDRMETDRTPVHLVRSARRWAGAGTSGARVRHERREANDVGLSRIACERSARRSGRRMRKVAAGRLTAEALRAVVARTCFTRRSRRPSVPFLAKTGEVAGLGREPRFPLPERLCAVRDEPGVPAVAPVPGTFPGGCYGTRRASWDSKTICLQALGSARGRPRSSSRSRFRLRTGPCRALGADTPRDAELRGDLACSRLGSERKYVKRIYARDTGKGRRQFAR